MSKTFIQEKAREFLCEISFETSKTDEVGAYKFSKQEEKQ